MDTQCPASRCRDLECFFFFFLRSALSVASAARLGFRVERA
jgi:hypothetical protein